ncbi:hypothetical protein BRC93_12535 [Halobacteriales archaeon QS_5_70_15]|nr:MAG: hypothetical protein BRC93_12535 [Halobacteriales archaeon QS_5_70_15]
MGVDDPEAARERVAGVDWVETVAVVDGGIEAVVDSGERRVAPLLAAVGEVAEVHTVAVRKPTLERVFLELTGRSLREDDAGAGASAVGRPAANGHGGRR